MTQYSGGYYLHKTNMFRMGLNAHTSALTNPASKAALDAINRVQATAWRVNEWVLDVMRECWMNEIPVPGVPSADGTAVPNRMPDDLWAKMTDEEKKAFKREKARAYTANAREVSHRDAFLRKMELAEEMRKHDAMWFPHAFDFRFRMYPMPQDLNPQGDDIAKSLLMFSEGKPLGRSGYRWLQIHAANTYGQDKLSLQERVDWCQRNMPEIIRSASDPIAERFWMEADEPFCFLAAAREIYHAAEFGFDHISHLPVQVDGSCNGLQHLSALGRDRVGAVATNVAANTQRQDIYQRVADAASKLVAADVAAGVPEAIIWAGQIHRKTVKRAVMTTPYGVTNRGIRDQLVDDRITHDVLEEEEGHHAAAEYLTNIIRRAMDETISSAAQIMGYLQGVAHAFAKAEMPFVWTTPSGCKVAQSYYQLAGRNIKTLLGKITLLYEDQNQKLNTNKARNGAAPNVIHSFDAAHLQLTVNYCAEVYGISSFSMIHDSYGTHACDMDNMAKALRRTFADVYSRPVLEDFHREQMEIAEPLGIELPVPPVLGDFDVVEVLKSDFFFA